jgi:SMC interacting uncharacterized protein involved in chromosome segregation
MTEKEIKENLSTEAELPKDSLKEPIGMDYKTTIEVHLAILNKLKQENQQLKKEIERLNKEVNILKSSLNPEEIEVAELRRVNEQLKSQLKGQAKQIFDIIKNDLNGVKCSINVGIRSESNLAVESYIESLLKELKKKWC